MEKAEWVFTNLHFRMQTAPAPIRVLYYRYTCERPVVMHTHEFSELVLVTGGCARHTAVSADGEKFTRILSRGDVLLIHEGEAHDFRLGAGESWKSPTWFTARRRWASFSGGMTRTAALCR